jgi:hypothetical protein
VAGLGLQAGQGGEPGAPRLQVDVPRGTHLEVQQDPAAGLAVPGLGLDPGGVRELHPGEPAV